MIGIGRGLATLIGAAVAGFLIWVAAQLGTETASDYWLTHGLVAAAGLAMALSQLLGGWTKWGWPRLSLGVFLLGFLPALLVGGWVLLARQPADFFNTSNWSRDLGIIGVVGDLGEFLAAIAFLVGLTFGFTFDTTGRRRDVVVDREHERTVHHHDGAGHTAADEQLSADGHDDGDEDYREPDPSFRETIVGDRRNEPRP